MITSYYVENELTSPKFAKAFAKGCGGNTATKYHGGDWAGFGSPNNWQDLMACIKNGNTFYYGDHGYFGRGMFYRITKNAFQHNGTIDQTACLKRLRCFYQQAAPWKNGKNIIICPQSQSHHNRAGVKDWFKDTLNIVKQHTDRPIIVRTKTDRRPIDEDLNDAWCVITHNSAAAIHAIMNGVPAFCTGQGAASPMSLSDLRLIEYPYRPDGRYFWAATLANNQWTLEEISNGRFYKEKMK